MPRRTTLPPGLTERPFTNAQATAAGVGPWRLKAGDVIRPFHGVHIAASSPLGVAALCRAFNARARTPHVFTHVTAARIHDLPLPRRLLIDPRLHVAVVAPARSLRAAGVIGHKLVASEIRLRHVDGVTVIAAADAWCQLTTLLGLDELIVIGDALVRRQNPLATLEELHEAVRRYGSRRGARRLRAALSLVRKGVDSPRETLLRLLLFRAALPQPEINGVILNGLGKFLAFGDLVFRKYRVLVEYDGGHHREDASQYHHDIDRLDDVMAERWRVVRINKTHMAGSGDVAIERVRRALTAAGWFPEP